MLDQTKAPLLEMLQKMAQRPHAPFYTPGHKRGQGIAPELRTWLGMAMFQGDLPELPELDNLFAPQGVIQSAQKLAADAFGATASRFLVNGSTSGIVAAILATCGSREKIILPRNIHQSLISGLILSGAMPIFVSPEYDPDWDLAYSISAQAVAAALAAHPDAKAVMMVYPTYHGVCGDVAQIAEMTHHYKIPLLVDEAHGAHFAFHPDLPTSALAAGADLTVQSIHKVLGAMTQASMLHVQGLLIDRNQLNQLNQALQMVQSSSPSYLLLASLDAARRQMAIAGREIMAKTLKLAADARVRIAEIPGLSVLEAPTLPSPGFCVLDPTRLTVQVTGLGLTGYQADEILHEQLGVTAELPSLRHLTFIISLGNTTTDIDRLVAGLRRLSEDYYLENDVPESASLGQPSQQKPLGFAPKADIMPVMTPREAFFAPVETLPIEESVGSISAELVCPYPPGIPVLMPGEAIEASCLEFLRQILANGGTITGCSDPELNTISVVK
jgi:arginine decarboxylase